MSVKARKDREVMTGIAIDNAGIDECKMDCVLMDAK